MTTLTTILNAFQAINATISGVAAAPQVDAYPAVLTPDKLPAALTLPGPATWHAGGSGMGRLRKCVRTYVVRVYVAPDSAPDVGQVFTDLAALMDACGAAYRALATVGGGTIQFSPSAGVEDLGALRTIGYGGAQYYAFELRVPVTEVA